jgi:hypothetical protein
MTTLSTFQGAAETTEERSMPFEAVEGGEETTSAAVLLVVAYILIWAGFMAFVWLTMMRQKRIDARLDDLERSLGQKDDRDAPA